MSGGSVMARSTFSFSVRISAGSKLVGSSMGNHAQFARALNWIRIGKAKAPVSRVFPFEELPDALRFLESGDQTGNVVLAHDS